MAIKFSITQRKEVLEKLLESIEEHENAILDALHKDFGKSRFEGIVTETSIVKNELKLTIKNIRKWAKPKRVFPSLLNFPSTDILYSEPYGKTLIISPWNYPFQLALNPLIMAIAAGNSVTLKPSELTPNTAEIISKIIRETFEVKQCVVITGDALVAQELLKQRWDYIFFTGSVAVGKIIAKTAAENLTPTTLELGGKNPCIVHQSANIKIAAKRIVWGKLLNAGQTCIAPDYLLVHHKIKEVFVKALITEIETALGKDGLHSADYTQIVNKNHFNRLLKCIEGEQILFGGNVAVEKLSIMPTLINEPSQDSEVMTQEIFGPVLPIFGYETFDDLEKIIYKQEKPLTLYVFTEEDSFAKKCITTFSYGGGCVNDTMGYFSNHRLPFGGIGHSGIGAYHGKYGFDTFSHKKPVMQKATWLDLPMRYMPYGKKVNWIGKLLAWVK
jgi:aldehyde dehydrogenase (NAD+)